MIMANTVSVNFAHEIYLLKSAIHQTHDMITKLSNENLRLKQLLEEYYSKEEKNANQVQER